MERPNHLSSENPSTTSRLGGLVIVAGIHTVAILGLIAALNQGQIIKQIHEIQASVEREKAPPKLPPPPPIDLPKPTPPVAILPVFTMQAETPATITVQKPQPPVTPPSRTVTPQPPPPTELKPIARTHVTPQYPTISQRLGEQGTSTLKVNIDTSGSVSDCSIAKSSGSDRLDAAACDYVKAHWKWQPPTSDGKAVSATTELAIIWNLKDAQ
jgi:protein TonB